MTISLFFRSEGQTLKSMELEIKSSKLKKKKKISPRNENKGFSCQFCKLPFESSKELNEHYRECHVECDLCEQIFKRRYNLKTHMKLQHSDISGKVNCDYCSKTFSTHMSRWIHTKTIHKKNWKYKCNECEYGTTHLSLFQNHVKKHVEPLNLRCDQCDKEFKSQYRYNVHMKIHEKGLTCSVCNKTFDKRKNMLRHMSRNHGRKKKRDVPCNICSKMFFDKWALRVHMEVHNNKKEKCQFCDYATCHPKNLKAHVKNHVKEFDFVCELCGRGFVYNFMLRDHMVKEHGEGIPRIPCEICGKTFATQQYLNVHKQSHEPDYEKRNHQCEICGKRFLTRSMLLRHIRGHSKVVHYVCRFCNKFLSCLATLKDHEKIHTGEKPFICEVCGKSFGAKKYLVTHSRTHTNEKPYSCQECGSAFSQRGTLSIHLKSHLKKETF